MSARDPKSPPEPNIEADLGGALEFMQSIWALAHALQTRSAAMERTIGLTGPQRLVLRILGRYPAISAGDLADVLHIHPSTLSGILSRLARRRLVARTADPQDGRKVRLSLTARGATFDVVQPGTVESAIEATLRRTPPSQVRIAGAVMDALTAQLESTPE